MSKSPIESVAFRYYFLLGRHNGKNWRAARDAAAAYDRYVSAQAQRGVTIVMTYADVLMGPTPLPS